jgi:phosphoglycolate phosphatase
MIQIIRNIPVDALKLLVFDLDGTLVDTAQDLSNSVNAALEHIGRKPLPDKIIAGFTGNGAAMQVRRSIACERGIQPEEADESELAKAYSFFLDHYRVHKLDFTLAYAGAIESLEILAQPWRGKHRTLMVATNKPEEPARGICEGLGLSRFFVHVYGGDSFSKKKPDPFVLRLLMKEVDAKPEETVLIGDSHVDVLTARNAGVWCLGSKFGFGPQNLMVMPPDVVVDSARDWATILAPGRSQS